MSKQETRGGEFYAALLVNSVRNQEWESDGFLVHKFRKGFVKYTNQYSVFSADDLRKWYKHKNNFTVVKMLYNVAFTKRVIRKTLLDDVGLNGNAY